MLISVVAIAAAIGTFWRRWLRRDVAESIRAVISGVEEGKDLRSLLNENEVRTPQGFERQGRRESTEAIIVYTDLEPDDIFGITCLREERLISAVIVTVDLKTKDKGGILAKKMVMAATALGIDFVEEMFIVKTAGEREEGSSGSALAKACNRIRAVAGTAEEVHWYIMAPGRGNLEQLLCTRDHKMNRVFIYSGAFNMREPNMTERDIAAITKLATARPLVDVARWRFFKRHPSLQGAGSLAALWPSVEIDCRKVNPGFAQAWREFSLEFNAYLVGPSNTGIFEEDLDDREQIIYNAIKELDIKQYCKALMHVKTITVSFTIVDAVSITIAKPLFNKLKEFKQSTVRAVAEDKLDGPLCDTILPFVSLCKVDREIGHWHWNSEKGHTSLDQTTGRCKVEMPVLLERNDNIEAMKEHLSKTILNGLALEKRSSLLARWIEWFLPPKV